MTLADKIVVLRDGRVEQVGSPRQLYERPDNIFVAQFIGSPKMNILPAAATGGFGAQPTHRECRDTARAPLHRPRREKAISRGRS